MNRTGTKHIVCHMKKSVVQWSVISKFTCIINRYHQSPSFLLCSGRGLRAGPSWTNAWSSSSSTATASRPNPGWPRARPPWPARTAWTAAPTPPSISSSRNTKTSTAPSTPKRRRSTPYSSSESSLSRPIITIRIRSSSNAGRSSTAGSDLRPRSSRIAPSWARHRICSSSRETQTRWRSGSVRNCRSPWTSPTRIQSMCR